MCIPRFSIFNKLIDTQPRCIFLLCPQPPQRRLAENEIGVDRLIDSGMPFQGLAGFPANQNLHLPQIGKILTQTVCQTVD